MKVRTQYDAFDPDVRPSDPMLEFEQDPDVLDAPDAPDDAYTIDKHGNTVKDPLGAAASVDQAPKAWVMPLAILLVITCVGLTAWNVNRAVSGPPPLPQPTATQVKQTLYLGVMRVDAVPARARRDSGDASGRRVAGERRVHLSARGLDALRSRLRKRRFEARVRLERSQRDLLRPCTRSSYDGSDAMSAPANANEKPAVVPARERPASRSSSS